MEAATGEWLTFVDADDRISPDHLARYVEGIEQAKERPDIVAGGFVLEQPNYNVVCDMSLPEGCDKRQFVMEVDSLIRVVTWNKLYRAEFARQVSFNTHYSMHEDTEWMTRQLGRTDRIAFIPMSGYRYAMVFAGSNISRYAAFCEDAQKDISANMHRLYQQIGLSAEEVATMDRQRLFEQNADCLRNLFKPDSPLSLSEKHREVKRLLFKTEGIGRAIAEYPRAGEPTAFKLFRLCHRLHAPWLVTILLDQLYRRKHSRMKKQL